MTREEAKDILMLRRDMHEETAKALDMAIEALKGGDAEMNEINPKQYMQVSPNNGADLISRAEAIKAVENLPNAYNGWSDTYDKAYIIGVLEDVPSAEAVPQLKQTDTLIIADALRYLVKDTKRHELDRTRADALRQQFLKYGASMCKGGDDE